MENVLLGLLRAQYGALADRIVSGFTPRAATFRVNRLKSDPTRVQEELEGCGIRVRGVPWYADAFLVENADSEALAGTAVYERGEIYLQNLSAMLPPLALDPRAGESVLDMAAAPGGKTTQLLALSGGKALITACERDKFRFERLKFNLMRQGAERVAAIRTDAAALDEAFRFDKILLDAPCSGSGTATALSAVRISEAYLERCVRLQEKLLRKAFRLLKKGGTLVYSTCSVLRQENEEPFFRAVEAAGASFVPAEAPQGVPLLPSREGTVCVCPTREYEGFFLAKAVKR